MPDIPAKPVADVTSWHNLSADDAAQRLGVDVAHGLTTEAVEQRILKFGPNEIEEAEPRSFLRMFGSQFTDFMILVLIAAAVVSGLVGEPEDTIAIIVIVVLNGVIGSVQEYRAQRAVEALRRMTAPEARVLRRGGVDVVTAQNVVPGDVVLLEAGNVVPADLRLFDASDFRLDESALTGESQPVEKDVTTLEQLDLPLGDRLNMAYKGTLVANGRGTGLVVATGMATELGSVASMLRVTESVKTPLQRRLARFGRHLAVAILVVCAIVFGVGLLRGEAVVLMFLTAVTLAVAAIPEALPAVVTVSLALGARKMIKRNALIRRLPAVETLGSITYICSDKTGTLTQNKMHVDAVFADGHLQSGLPKKNWSEPPWTVLGKALALSNDATRSLESEAVGDPTEVALYLGGQAAGFEKSELELSTPRVGEIPFDSDRRCMTTLHQASEGYTAFVKGAPEAILGQCDKELTRQGEGSFDSQAVLEDAERLAANGYRVLAFACRSLSELPQHLSPDVVEQQLTFLGLVGLIDPPREGAAEAVASCMSAGITPIMITGDHPGTAKAIAKRLGITNDDGLVITGRDLAQLSLEELQRRVKDIRVYARVSPEQKINIVRALQASGEFAAMTGDGVNDAPALQRADIGVAMGLKGTDVAREAADMVLLDDNFVTIVSAVREGRRIFDNIRKFIKYTMTSNSGEIWTLFLAPFFGLPIPLWPIQILWINLVTDGLPGLALAAEPEERGVMKRPPRPPNESIFAHGMWQHVIWAGLLIGGLSISSQAWAYYGSSSNWQTMVFTVLTLCQLAHALVIRSERESLFSIKIRSNLPLLGAVILTLGLQLSIIYIPFFNPIFKTSPLTLEELGICLLLPGVVFVAVEIEKWLVRRGVLYQERLAQADL